MVAPLLSSDTFFLLFSHQQQVLSRDPDRVGEGVIILVLHKLLRVSCPHFDLKRNNTNILGFFFFASTYTCIFYQMLQSFLTWSSVICMYRMM